MELVTPVDARIVGGRLVSSVITRVQPARVEIVRRAAINSIDWTFRQRVPTLLWYERGADQYRLDVDGQTIESRISPTTSLAFYPAGVSVKGSFHVDEDTVYVIAFLDPDAVADRKVQLPSRPLVGFDHPALVEGCRQLIHEGKRAGRHFDLYAESWTLLTLFHLDRIGESWTATSGREGACAAGAGLPSHIRDQLDAYVRANLAAHITVDDLARVAGYSRRQLTRLYRQGLGNSPLRHVHNIRIAEARRLLLETDRAITAIAAQCGFGSVQHFSSAFRSAVGSSPRTYRRVHTS